MHKEGIPGAANSYPQQKVPDACASAAASAARPQPPPAPRTHRRHVSKARDLFLDAAGRLHGRDNVQGQGNLIGTAASTVC